MTWCCMEPGHLGAVSVWRVSFPGMGIPMLKIRRSWDRLIFNMRIPILVRRHLYIETAWMHAILDISILRQPEGMPFLTSLYWDSLKACHSWHLYIETAWRHAILDISILRQPEGMPFSTSLYWNSLKACHSRHLYIETAWRHAILDISILRQPEGMPFSTSLYWDSLKSCHSRSVHGMFHCQKLNSWGPFY